MGILRDFRLFFLFRKTIRKNKTELLSNFNIRIDNADRLYTVLNIPDSLFGEPYNIRKADIDAISESYIREYISKLSSYLNSIGLSEMYDYYDVIKKVDKYSYLIVLGYKQIDSISINRFIYRIFIPVASISAIISLIIYLL